MTDNRYPIKTLHRDIDRVITNWGKEGFYVTIFGRDRSTRSLTITFSEKPTKRKIKNLTSAPRIYTSHKEN